ncbi:hypothetical protein GCM10007891_01000 [Methylophaga thalassica]|uniref:PilZ domain-containing protein n=1 Tax=Methylophaga thalassica TaxID=40223 RepID=A0ABQ5TPB1_9GAMM|nr:hypothetical protein [Methylophaga thalassica]GLP98246.1 hypothetical protein GCM10007891_01000 [Methylophaga thalassica]
MSLRYLKLLGLSESEIRSLKSMLRIASPLLTSQWSITDSNEADLVIYSFDSIAGRKAWQKRSASLTGLLTHHADSHEPVDIIFQKPLHKTQFAETLNLAEQKLSSHQSVKKSNSQLIPQTKASWLNTFHHLVGFSKKPADNLPALNLQAVSHDENAVSTIKDPALLLVWLNQLPNDTYQRVPSLLANLKALTQQKIKPGLLLPLLEMYRSQVNELLFTRDIAAVKRDLYMNTESLRTISLINELIGLLSVAYQQIVRFFYQRGKTPLAQPLMLLALNRTAEMLGLQLLHSFQYYRVAPAGIWQLLHELFLYQEKAQTLHQEVTVKPYYQSRSFFEIYGQIVLTALTDPYSQMRFDVLRLFRLMSQFTDKIVIVRLSEQQSKVNSRFLLLGHFCINAQQDHCPQPMHNIPKEIRSAETSRLFDAQAVLKSIETTLREAKSHRTHTVMSAELRLVRHILPQLNTSYERRFERIKQETDEHIQITLGLESVHQSLQGNLVNALDWQLVNLSNGGMMAKRAHTDCYHLNIGDFVGLFDINQKVTLAVIKWLQIDIHNDVQIGLERIIGKPEPVMCQPADEQEEHPALLLQTDNVTQANTKIILTEKGIFSPNRKIQINGQSTPYSILANGLIDSSLDYEIFNYNLNLGS